MFGAVPRIPLPSTQTLPPSQCQRFEAMRKAREEMETITAQRRIKAALKHRHGLRNPPSFKFGDKARIWREDLNRFTGPFTVHAYDNERTVYVMTDKIRPFSTSVVRLVSEEAQGPISPSELRNIPPEINAELEELQNKFGPSLPSENATHSFLCDAFLRDPISESAIRKFAEKGSSSAFITVIVKDKNDSRFDQAKIDEVEKWLSWVHLKLSQNHQSLEKGQFYTPDSF